MNHQKLIPEELLLNNQINTNTWRLNNTLLNNQEITEEIKKEIKKYLEKYDNENTTIQNLWDAATAVYSFIKPVCLHHGAFG